MIDLYRKILDTSIQSARLYQSKTTGFVHDTPEVISIYTNFLFSLSLLRQKTQECIQEAKFVLDRLLAFQQESGNFPEYMHDFPVCRNNGNAAKILVPLYWIRKEFSHILGEALSKRLTASFEAAEKWAKEHPIRLEKAYEEMTPNKLSETICAAQIKGECSPEFQAFLSNTWHMPSKKYCGKAPTLQVGYLPEITLYDYFLGYFSDNMQDAALKPQFAAIQAALLPAAKLPLHAVQQQPWHITLQKTNEPLSLVAGLHTALLELPGGVVESAESGTITMQLSQDILPDNIEKADVLSFFVDALPDVDISINRQKSTTFTMADSLSITMGTIHLQLAFQLEGMPEFMGHVVKSNRPRQRLHDRAYDWQILLRKVRGEGPSKLTLTYSVSNVA